MTVRKFQEVSLWHNVTKNVMVAVMVLRSGLGSIRCLHCSTQRIKLTIAYVIDTRSSKRVCLWCEVLRRTPSRCRKSDERSTARRDAGVTDIHRYQNGKSKPPFPYYSRRRKCWPSSRWCNRSNAFERLPSLALSTFSRRSIYWSWEKGSL